MNTDRVSGNIMGLLLSGMCVIQYGRQMPLYYRDGYWSIKEWNTISITDFEISEKENKWNRYNVNC